MATTGGHLFIIDGDVSTLACDAWLLPTDLRFSITNSFCKAVGLPERAILPNAPSSWGGRGCLYLDHLNGDGRPDLWLGDIGRQGDDLQHYEQRAGEFIEAASARVRATRPDLGRPPLLAMNVIGSGRGGQRRRRGDLLNALIPAIHKAAVAHECDVVLVAYGSVMYAAAQTARRRLEKQYGLWRDLPASLRKKGDELVELALAGDLVVFFGAGVSAAAGIPVWGKLLDDVAEKIGLDAGDRQAIASLDFRDQATILARKGGDRFWKEVNAAVAADRPSLLHGLLSSLPVREFVTTNFDTLFETSAGTAGRSLVVLPGASPRSSDRWLLKLHGTAGRDLVLTRGDYIGAAAQHVALRGLVQAMLMTRRMLFVGYSLNDDDFHQIVHEVRSALGDGHGKFGTALMPDPHRLVSDLWDDMEIVNTSLEDDPGEAGVQPAARRMAILLDYVGSRSSSGTHFVADDSLGELRSEDEDRLAAIVGDLRALYDSVQSKTDKKDGWSDVANFLEKFGSEP